MLAISNDELGSELGPTIKCNRCGNIHDVQYGDKINQDGTKSPSRLLAFFKCGDKSYLCGINGKNIIRRQCNGV